jgi:ferredoxin-type protein NapH
MKRSIAQKIFIWIYLPVLVLFYTIYKYPLWYVPLDQVVDTFYWFGKSSSFWYATVYTFLVCFVAFRIIVNQKNPYSKSKKSISRYQKNKFVSIFFSQLIFFYLIPFVVPSFIGDRSFFADTYQAPNKDAYVYLYNGFTSLPGFIYIFIVIPVSVWFFGKRYCSWFCACGNLAETVGVTVWGNQWVKEGTPRGERAQKLEWIQYLFMVFAIVFGLFLLADIYKIIVTPGVIHTMRAIQDLVVDLIFGGLIGLGAYPFLGTRIWCRYGCPLAGFMKVFGKYARSQFKVAANDKCKGLDLCTLQCPMGIDVASFAHKNKKPIMGSFSLDNTTCIGCGGCIDVCPVNALEFK